MKKKDFIKLHRELWDRISIIFDSGGSELEDAINILKGQIINILKEQVINDMRKEHLLNCLTRKEIDYACDFGCFACAYKYNYKHEPGDCSLCPLDWGTDEIYFSCETETTPYSAIVKEFHRFCEHDWKHLAELARQVRDLPLKEGVLDD